MEEIENNNCSSECEESPEVKKTFKYTKRQWTVFILFMCLNLCAGIIFSIIGPFYPKEAEKKGVSPSVYGFVFGVFELVNFISCPIYGKFIGVLGTKFTLNAGNFVMSICCILFGLLDKAAPRPFIILSFAVRIVESLGTSAFITASYATIAQEFSSSIATTFSILETGFGFGMIIGPMLGGVLFEAGGYILPFLTVGSILFVTSCITFFILPTQESYSSRSMSFTKLLAIPSILICCFSVFSVAFSFGFISATLEPHLRQFNLSPTLVGSVFIVPGGIYALTAPIWGWLTDNMLHPKIICGIGGVSITIGFLLVGPVPFLPIKSSLWITFVGLSFLGIGVGAEYVSAFLDSTQEAFRNGFPNDMQTYGFVSGLWFSCTALGSFVGPSIGGILLDHVGFRSGSVLVFVLHALVAIFSFGYYFWDRKRSRVSMDSLSETNPLLQ